MLLYATIFVFCLITESAVKATVSRLGIGSIVLCTDGITKEYFTAQISVRITIMCSNSWNRRDSRDVFLLLGEFHSTSWN